LKAGYIVHVAQNAWEAMEKIKRDNFNLIVSDVRIPEINGIEIIQKIRAYLLQNGLPAVPEILITGYASEENFDKA